MPDLARAIKQKLRECTTVAEIDAVADLHREDVLTMTKSDDRDVRVMAIQIANLKAYQINLVRRR